MDDFGNVRVNVTLAFPSRLSREVIEDRIRLVSDGRLTLAAAEAFVESWDTRHLLEATT